MVNPHTLEELFASVSLAAPERAVGFVLWRVLHRYQRAIDQALARLELTHLQFTTLAMAAWLGKSGQPVSQKQLANAADMLPMQISLMLKALEDKQLVRRVRHRDDQRAKAVELTARGVKILRKAIPLAVQVQQTLFGHADGVVGGPLLAQLRSVELAAAADGPQGSD